MGFLKFCGATIHDPCIQLAAKIKYFYSSSWKKLNISYLSPDENLTKFCEMKKKTFLFYSDALLTKRGYKHNSKTNKKNFRKKLDKSEGRSNN